VPTPAEGTGRRPRDSAIRTSQRFVTVDELPVGSDDDHRPVQHWMSPQTLLFLIGLVLVGLVVAYFLQPPTADALERRINERLSERGNGGLLACEDDIRAFLEHHSTDTRAAKMWPLLDDIELLKVERRLEQQAKQPNSSNRLTHAELAFLEAIRLEDTDPPACLEKLSAVVNLYEEGRGATSKKAQQCILLAMKRAARIKTAAEQFIEQHQALLDERLRQAEQLAPTDPTSASKIRQAIVQIYADKPWAADRVRLAKEALDKAAPPPQTP